MKEDYSFLPLLIQEELYVIADKEAPQKNAKEEIKKEKKKEETKKEVTTETSVPFLGDNQQQVVIVTDIFEEEHQEFLLKILQAVRLSLKDVAVVQLSDLQAFEQLYDMPHRVMISFGVQHDDFIMDMDTASYMVIKKPGKKYLLADSLSALTGDKKLKALLWANLQKIFLA